MTTVNSTRGAAPQIIQGDNDIQGKGGVEKQKEAKKEGFFSFAKDMFSKATSLRFGSIAEAVCDRIGLPESVGDIAGMCVGLATMNFVEVAEHGADLVSDIARKNGNEKLAGFCDAAQDKLGKFNQSTGKIGFMVASTVLTGGAGAAALGASSAGASVTVGSLTMSGGQIMQGINLIGGAINAGEALERGDKMGALGSAFGVLGNLGGLGELFGMSPQTAQGLTKFAEHGQFGLGIFQKASADGKLDLKDLAHIPLGEVLGRLNVDTSGIPPEGMELAQGALGVLGNEDRKGAAMNLLTDFLMGKAMEKLGGGEDDAQLRDGLSFAQESLQTGAQSPQAMQLFTMLLSQLQSGLQEQSVRDQRASMIKA